jgi:cysteine-rich repeat protein
VDAGVAPPLPGDVCETNDECGPDQLCWSLFDPGVDTPSTCFSICETLGEPCVTGNPRYPQDGVCRTIGPTTSPICVKQSGLLEACGNGASATCVSNFAALNYGSCVLSIPGTEEGVGVCTVLCNPDAPTTCQLLDPDSPACGCPPAFDCSTNLIFPGDGVNDGICTRPSAPGDSCGYNDVGDLSMCSSPQTCTSIQDVGVCQGNQPPPWRCPYAWRGAGDGCDCGCGAPDPDCADASVATCDNWAGCAYDEVPDPLSPTHCIPNLCGDGTRAGDEWCDDGNPFDDDGCTDCLPDPGAVCVRRGAGIGDDCGVAGTALGIQQAYVYPDPNDPDRRRFDFIVTGWGFDVPVLQLDAWTEDGEALLVDATNSAGATVGNPTEVSSLIGGFEGARLGRFRLSVTSAPLVSETIVVELGEAPGLGELCADVVIDGVAPCREGTCTWDASGNPPASRCLADAADAGISDGG